MLSIRAPTESRFAFLAALALVRLANMKAISRPIGAAIAVAIARLRKLFSVASSTDRSSRFRVPIESKSAKFSSETWPPNMNALANSKTIGRAINSPTTETISATAGASLRSILGLDPSSVPARFRLASFCERDAKKVSAHSTICTSDRAAARGRSKCCSAALPISVSIVFTLPPAKASTMP